MTTKPRVNKFRLRGSAPLSGAAAARRPDPRPDDAEHAPPSHGSGSIEERLEKALERQAQAPRRSEGEPPGDGEPRGAEAGTGAGPTDIAAIRAEGLTGRQLRMARRMAMKHGLAAASDFDAVRELRLAGIDPFERANMLELVISGRGAQRAEEGAGPVQLPQTVDPAGLPSRETRQPGADPDPRRQLGQVRAIQRDIARRRRRKLVLLAARLAFFVFLPTALAGWYYFRIATPMYATNTEFVIQKADGPAPAAMGGLLSGTSFATSQDSIMVQSYLGSRDAMLRLDADAGFKAHFSQDWIDPIQRLPEGASNERAYALYQDHVRIGYDPTEGIVKMEVIAADPEISAEYSRRLIDYAEDRVDSITLRLREDQMAGARESLEIAEANMLAAQARVVDLQERQGVFDPASETAAVMGQIATFETELQQKRLELAQLTANRRPNEARVAGVEGDIARLERVVEGLRGQMTTSSDDAASLARVSAELRVAETALATRTAMVQQALQALESARIEANRQVRYLSVGVAPIPPDRARYPRAFENTALAFVICAGLYLLLSLTASILREQVAN